MKKNNVRQTDFKENERPRTRFLQFFDIFKHRFVELMKISLLQAVFNMPLIGTLISFYSLVRSSSDINSLMTVFIITSICLLVSVIFSIVGLTGSFYCLKKIAYAEGEFASSSYFVGLVENWKKAVSVGFIAGISLSVTMIGSFFFYYKLSSVNAAIAGFGIAILVIQAMVVLMMSYYSIAQIIIYENKLKFILKNSFIFTLMRFQFNLPAFIIHPGVIVVLTSIMEITMFVAVGLIILFVSIGHLIWFLNILSGFDKFINKDHYPDYYKKGLYKEA